ncbi:MAG TPA: AMP-binding protein, partial [Fimbriimonadaceae bacterium]|nr:AMP-binding protein [Fimbriimonadaceae bacterium]
MEAKSLADMLRRSCRTYADKDAMLCPDGKGFRRITYRELEEQVRLYAGALKSLGLQRGDKLAIQSENMPEWAICDWACQTVGVVVVPIYPTLPPDQTQYIVTNSEAKLVVTSTAEQAAKSQDLQGVRVILLRGSEDSLDALAKARAGELVQGVWEREIDLAKAEDVATIIYTSGTTGAPKGAMLQHRAFTFICEQALQSLPIGHADTFLSFLPMSHVYERVAGQALPISCGATVAYAKSLMTLANDMVAAKPTIMLCVPRFLEATMDKITDAARKNPPVRRKLFDWALSQGAKKAKGGFAPLAGVLDKLVGSKIREKTGGRMRFFVS